MSEAVFAIIHLGNGMVGAVTTAIDKLESKNGITLGLPGGKVDDGETHLQALVRECNEEGWGGELIFIPEPIHFEHVKGYDCYWYYLNIRNSSPYMLVNYKEHYRNIYPIITHYKNVMGLGNEEAFQKAFEGKHENVKSHPISRRFR